MKLFFLSLLLVLCTAYSCQAGTPAYTTVTATLTDGTGTVWAGAMVTVAFQPVANNPNAPLNNGNAVKGPQSTTADAGGTFTFSQLDDNSVVVPTGSTTKFTICPNASVPVCTTVTVALSGASENLSALLSAQLTPVTVQANPTLARAYNDAEVVAGGGLVYGSQYFRISDFTLRLWNGGSFVGGGGGGGGGTPGGADHQLQWNSAGTFGGLQNFTVFNLAYLMTQNANNDTLLAMNRNTDVSPTGNFILGRNAALATIWKIAIDGSATFANLCTGSCSGGSFLTGTYNASVGYQVGGVPLASANLSDTTDLLHASTFTTGQLPAGTGYNLYQEAATLGTLTTSTGSAANMFTGYTLLSNVLTAGHRVEIGFCYQHTTGVDSTSYQLLFGSTTANIFSATASTNLTCVYYSIYAVDATHEVLVQHAGPNSAGTLVAPARSAITTNLASTVIINVTENSTVTVNGFTGWTLTVDLF